MRSKHTERLRPSATSERHDNLAAGRVETRVLELLLITPNVLQACFRQQLQQSGDPAQPPKYTSEKTHKQSHKQNNKLLTISLNRTLCLADKQATVINRNMAALVAKNDPYLR